MLQTAIARLRSFWSNADIYIFTKSPEHLATQISGTKPLLLNGRQLWFYPLLDYASKIPNQTVANTCLQLDEKLRDHAPGVFKLIFDRKLKRYSSDHSENFKLFIETIQDADLVVASGGGYINDIFKSQATDVLDTIGFASKLGKPTALLGQGLGPLNDPQLIEKQERILPHVSLIGVREKRYSAPLLKGLGVAHDRVYVTGDDAIEAAYNARPAELGNSIGLNLRLASYSCINKSVIPVLQSTLYKAANLLGANLIPTPISLHSNSKETPDSVVINEILTDDSRVLEEAIDTPLKAIQQVGRCRLVITGSYHAGVFALSQGIPAIGLAMSEYYREKFSGLADQFGVGCEVICLDDDQFEDKLLNCIQTLWTEAESLRVPLLKSAELQIQSGWNAYRKLYELVSSNQNKNSL